MKLTRNYSSVRLATNYSTSKDFARNLIFFFTQVQNLARRAETDTRKYLNGLKPKDKDD